MTSIIFITSAPGARAEKDTIYKNIITGDHEVLYSGQPCGLMDHKLITAVNESYIFRVYYRIKINAPFIFLGWTNNSSIIKERITEKGTHAEPNERLQIKLVLPCSNIMNTQINSSFEGSGKYKKAVLQHAGFNVDRESSAFGFYTRNLANENYT